MSDLSRFECIPPCMQLLQSQYVLGRSSATRMGFFALSSPPLGVGESLEQELQEGDGERSGSQSMGNEDAPRIL